MFNNNNINDWLEKEEVLIESIPSIDHLLPMANSRLPFMAEMSPMSEIPSPYQSLFKFHVFNSIQSQCLPTLLHNTQSTVISAPTGSGKTVLLELAMVQSLLTHGRESKIIYMAPTKSLCNERVRDWEHKFKPLGIECKEFTGDTQSSTMAAIGSTTIIVTTPEKWDSLTRRWIDYRQLMLYIKLFLIDEVHILNEKRGSVLEACISRMKTINRSIRYVAVSATVPNLNDIAQWLNGQAISFSEEHRPIQLERYVYGYRPTEDNMFLFDRKMDWKLLDIIKKHSHNKSVLIFCSTRKSAQLACETIVKMMNTRKMNSLCSAAPSTSFKDKALSKLVNKGIAFHHAGLQLDDRLKLEDLFLKKYIRVLATTSTLAVGVNLPAHLVIIKSTKGYQNGCLSEYSDLDILQMMGRAGRVGLDTSGCVIILTTQDMEHKYKSLVNGTTQIESSLHQNLLEHFLSEICLGTITNENTALHWLHSTFLYVRISKNPNYYNLSRVADDEVLKDISAQNLQSLKEANLINESDAVFTPTVYGLTMDRYYVKFPSMILIMEKKEKDTMKDILQLVGDCHAEMSTIRFNSGEKQFLNSILKNPSIKYPIEKVSSIGDKIMVLIQCVLGDISLHCTSNTLLISEASTIINHASRIMRCLIDCCVEDGTSTRLKNALELYQSIQAKLWATSPFVLRQLDKIGPKLVATLAAANVVSFDQLRRLDPGHIEMIVHRNPPFGTTILNGLDNIPEFFLHVKEDLRGQLNLNVTIGIKNKRMKKAIGYAVFWIESGAQLIDFRRIHLSRLLDGPQSFNLSINPTSEIKCHLQSEKYVGTDVQYIIQSIKNPRQSITLTQALIVDTDPVFDNDDVWIQCANREDFFKRPREPSPLPCSKKTRREDVNMEEQWKSQRI
ncbi:P-loop containing nucleoside triphosphate hydrolase protein [Pilobolus umbonatus]|nr:P-loop containing nucleoside triphosphate hydrolase protein [Pilobolus umbonatus]